MNKMAAKTNPDLRYGWLGFRPGCLQFLNTPQWFLLWMTLSNTFVSIVVSGLVGVILTSIEVRFQFTSNETGWISSAYEVAAMPMSVLMVLYGRKMHHPLLTGVGLLLMSIGSVIFIIPHFTTDPYIPKDIGGNVSDQYLCLADDNSTIFNRTCSTGTPQRSPLSGYLVVFIIARVFQGLGVTPVFTNTLLYLDDCLPKEKYSCYLSIWLVGGIVGPAIGYVLGGHLLSIFTDFTTSTADEVGITPDDPRWVGAWWLGFLLAAVLLFIISIPFFGYARDLPGAAEVRSHKVTEAHNATHNDVEDDVNDDTLTCSSLMTSCMTLLRNPVYVFLCLFCCADAFVVVGFTTFGPKYMETQFGVTAGLAGMIFGVMTVPGGAGGNLLAGYLIHRLRLTTAHLLRLEVGLTCLLVTTGFMLLLKCDPVTFAGVNHPYDNSTGVNLTAACNVDCACVNVPFRPLCGTDNIQYYSPCHAGCHQLDENDMLYYNCSCMAGAAHTSSTQPCTSALCASMPIFTALFFIAMFLLFMCMCMNGTVVIRCVPRRDRAAALGLQTILARLIGTVPAPIAFGAAFDWSCTLWQETCGQTGSCISYDNRQVSLYVFLFSMGLKMLSVVFMVACCLLYKPPVLGEGDLGLQKAVEVNGGVNYEEGGLENDVKITKF